MGEHLWAGKYNPHVRPGKKKEVNYCTLFTFILQAIIRIITELMLSDGAKD